MLFNQSPNTVDAFLNLDIVIKRAYLQIGGRYLKKFSRLSVRNDLAWTWFFAEFVKNSDLMWRQSVWSSVIAASVAAQHLKEGGLVSLPGAKPALGPTPGMVGYGMAKVGLDLLPQC